MNPAVVIVAIVLAGIVWRLLGGRTMPEPSNPSAVKAARQAAADIPRAFARVDELRAAAFAHSIEPALLAAIASRESRILDVDQEGGGGRGWFQNRHRLSRHLCGGVDRARETLRDDGELRRGAARGERSRRPLAGPVSRAPVSRVSRAVQRQQQEIVEAIRTGRDPDAATTGHDYVTDVLARRDVFADAGINA